MVRGHVLPQGLGKTIPFPGGVVFDARVHDAKGEVKDLLFPKDLNYTESQEMHEQYIRTHGRYDPGEQRTRGYDWEKAGVNEDTVFGKKHVPDQCALMLMHCSATADAGRVRGWRDKSSVPHSPAPSQTHLC